MPEAGSSSLTPSLTKDPKTPRNQVFIAHPATQQQQMQKITVMTTIMIAPAKIGLVENASNCFIGSAEKGEGSAGAAKALALAPVALWPISPPNLPPDLREPKSYPLLPSLGLNRPRTGLGDGTATAVLIPSVAT
jgi:hypothetical protein